ncbi:transcription factor NF-E4-like [Macaca mulatta]
MVLTLETNQPHGGKPATLNIFYPGKNLTSGAKTQEGLMSAFPVDTSLQPREQATVARQRKLLSRQSPFCACTSVTEFAYWALQAHGAAAPHRNLLGIHLHLAPASSAAMKATSPDNAQTQVSLPGHAPSEEDPVESQTMSDPFKDHPHPFPSQPKPPTRIPLALPLKTHGALEQMHWQIPSLHLSQG